MLQLTDLGCAYLKGGMVLFLGREAYAAVASVSKASELAMVPSKSTNRCATDGSGGCRSLLRPRITARAIKTSTAVHILEAMVWGGAVKFAEMPC